ncbi:AraC family transcriptional regulator [Leptospira meyeri]|uniref:AraC family transcriptional regulator n=1 Tax=Leptospira meyeri TaxID=29508 RepID=UPI000C2AC198|nr:helix-turn-helix domain-containing protein [Leptospira meyeri]PKA24687.1 AraC family transcriptional regulator [Leptospira sp. mixed culture ATI2-C-A1]MCW7489145.1 helix-turn-helix domain-containing protein [Leptospira meyeri]PJZ81933.1 AraC family transcriptional regulator [Leptospira meyeri]PJZ97436.1 AraC family transcriptional regulator [Leptospira meyeri]PKA12739.1 AraC family transcriptional regulator [Leptospira meyeri]
MWNLTSHLIAFSAGLSLLFAWGEFLRKNSSGQTKVQGLLFLFAAMFQAHTFFTTSGLYQLFPHFYLIHLPFTACIGALLKRYFSELWDESPNRNQFSFWELVPAAIVTILLTPFYLSSASEKIALHTKYLLEGVPLKFQITILIAVFPIFYAAFYVFRQMIKYIRLERFKSSAHLRLVGIVVGIGAFSSLIGVYTLFFHQRHGLELVSTFIALLLIGIYLLRQKSPELWGEVQRIVIEEKKYQTSQLGGFNLETLQNQLIHLMEDERIYRDESINLEKLANQMDLSEHQLSEYLNLHQKKSFFHLVNHYRIREAKELFASHPERNILTIAYDVGFPSKSTFYDAFKREVGTSPSEFRKSLGK